ncbi:hypothetical protein EAE96_006919 [Botrytis aclada]|nr:hypothetical protein EAE96_006919 [Botrytis aclada]
MGCKHEYLKESERENLYKGKATRKNGILNVSRHKASYLTKLLVKNASLQTTKLTEVQLEARSLSEEEEYNIDVFAEELSKHDTSSDAYLDLVREFIIGYTTVFDKLFFFKSLVATIRTRYKVQLRPRSTKTTPEITHGGTHETTVKISGITFPAFRDSDDRVTHALVELYVEANPKYTIKEQVLSWLGTLAHEMLHAFFFIFGCFKCYTSPEQLNEGLHGLAWQDAAYAIEIASLKILSADINLGRCDSINCDVIFEKMSWPEESFLRKWNMIGPNPKRQVPVHPLKSAGKTDDVAEKNSEPSTVQKQLPHHPKENLGGDKNERGKVVLSKSNQHGKKPEKCDPHKSSERGSNGKRETPKSGEGGNREKREPPRSGESGSHEKRGSSKSGEGGKCEPPKSGGGGKREPPKSGQREKEELEKSEPSSKNVGRGKDLEQRKPPGSGKREKRDPSREDSRRVRHEPHYKDDRGRRPNPSRKDDKSERVDRRDSSK